MDDIILKTQIFTFIFDVIWVWKGSPFKVIDNYNYWVIDGIRADVSFGIPISHRETRDLNNFIYSTINYNFLN